MRLTVNMQVYRRGEWSSCRAPPVGHRSILACKLSFSFPAVRCYSSIQLALAKRRHTSFGSFRPLAKLGHLFVGGKLKRAPSSSSVRKISSASQLGMHIRLAPPVQCFKWVVVGRTTNSNRPQFVYGNADLRAHSGNCLFRLVSTRPAASVSIRCSSFPATDSFSFIHSPATEISLFLSVHFLLGFTCSNFLIVAVW